MYTVLNITDLEGLGPPRKVAILPGVLLSPGQQMRVASKKLCSADPLVQGLLVMEDGEEIPALVQELLRVRKADKQLTGYTRGG